MARHHSFAARWTQYLAVRLAAFGLTLLDDQANLRTAASLGRFAYAIDHRHRQRTLQNLARSFPDLDRDQIEDLARRSFEHLVELAVEVCQTPRLIHADSWYQRIENKNVAQTVELLNSGKPVLMVSGHLGNWEAMGSLLSVMGYRVSAIARPIDNPLINDWLLGIRQRRGLRVITKWNATEAIVDVIKSGGLIGFIADQNAGDKGIFVPFFGRLASTYKSIGLLALTHEVPIVCGYVRRLEGFRYEMGTTDIIRPEDWVGRPDPLYYVTARYIRAIENMVRQFPEQYLWMHRRWRTRPRHERLGQPLPAALRQKIEDLPWVDDSLLNQVAQPG